jgi:hypothetical protein
MDELKPCPFCGARLVRHDAFSMRGNDCFVHPVPDPIPEIGCVAWDFRIYTKDADRIAAWNRRASPSPEGTRERGELVTRGDIMWLERAKDVGHCGEGSMERRGRDEHNARIDRILAALTLPPVPEPLQSRVKPWMLACFGEKIAADREERGDRLLEEVFELLQSGGYDPARVLALRDYVWSRPAGEPPQEVGGVMITLAAYCLAHGLDMHEAGETELARVWTKVETIRAKQAAKPSGSALPVATLPPVPGVDREGSSCTETAARGTTASRPDGPCQSELGEAASRLEDFARALTRGDTLTWFDGRPLNGSALGQDLMAVLVDLRELSRRVASAEYEAFDATEERNSVRDLLVRAAASDIAARRALGRIAYMRPPGPTPSGLKARDLIERMEKAALEALDSLNPAESGTGSPSEASAGTPATDAPSLPDSSCKSEGE